MTWDSTKLRTLRLRLGWSQSEIARRLAVPATFVEKWELGDLEMAADVCQQLDRMSQHLKDYNSQISRQSIAEAYFKITMVNQVSTDDLPPKNKS